MRRSAFAVVLILTFVAAWTASSSAQSKPIVTPVDYDKFEGLSTGAPRGGLSPDGAWVAYGITRIGGNNELRIVRATPTPGVEPRVVAFGTQAVFSARSDWIAYAIGQSEAEQERLRTARQPIQRKLGLLNLATQTETVIDGVESFAFDRTGRSLAMKRYAPAPAGAAPPAGGAAPVAGRSGGPHRRVATPRSGTTPSQGCQGS